MKIVFTGGGSGGHFYPIIAIAESVVKLSKDNKLVPPQMYFFSPTPYNQGLLYDHNITFKKSTAGKMRRYFSIKNFFDLFKTAWGIFSTTLDLFDVYPDVVFGKGGFASFPTLVAARILRIPVIIHESDSAPGRVNKWAGKFAIRVAVSYKEASTYFRPDKVAYTGQPVMDEKKNPITNGAHEFFGFDQSIPTLYIFGGSQGAEVINNIILDTLGDLVKKYQIIHQTGPANFEVMREAADAILLDSRFKNRYKLFGYMNNLEMMMAAGACSLVVSRAGSSLFEIASWGKASVVIPIANSNENHQVKNAFAYNEEGACSVIQEENLKPHIFTSEIDRIIEKPEIKQSMEEAAKRFFKPDAADKIATELLSIVLSHENLD